MLLRQLGQNGPHVSSIALGCMGMSEVYGQADRSESIATINAALDAGINLLDTGDFYGMGHNEMLLAQALQGRARDSFMLSGKFGALRDPAGNYTALDGRPVTVKNALAFSLKRLNTDYLDIYRLARVDPKVPIEDTVGAIADMVKAGYVRHVALSEAGAETIRRAAAVTPICDVQIEYSLISRGVEDKILPVMRELGIGMTAYGVLSRGLISGHWQADSAGAGDARRHYPRFMAANVDKNLVLVEGLRSFAAERGASVAQIAIAWVAARGEAIVPLIGARRRDRLAEALGARDIYLGKADMAELDMLVPKGSAAGDRYPTPQLRAMDSEK